MTAFRIILNQFILNLHKQAILRKNGDKVKFNVNFVNIDLYDNLAA